MNNYLLLILLCLSSCSTSSKSSNSNDFIYESDLINYTEGVHCSQISKNGLEKFVDFVMIGRVSKIDEGSHHYVIHFSVQDYLKGKTVAKEVQLIQLKTIARSLHLKLEEQYFVFGSIIQEIKNDKPVIKGNRPLKEESFISDNLQLIIPFNKSTLNLSYRTTLDETNTIEDLLSETPLFYVTPCQYYSVKEDMIVKILKEYGYTL